MGMETGGIEKVGLSLKQNMLSGLPFGPAFLDHAIKMNIENRDAKIHITRITVFDGLSLKSFDPSKGVTNKITVKKQGRVSHNSRPRLASLAQDGLEIGGSIAGIGSIIQLQQFGGKLLKAAGADMNDGKSTVKTTLKSNGKEIGEATYSATKYNSLRSIPDFAKHLVPNAYKESILGMPVLITNAVIDLDLRTATKSKSGLVDVRLRENDEVGNLSPEHARNVVISAYYDVAIGDTKNPQHHGSGLLSINLGKFTYDITAIDEKPSAYNRDFE